MFTIYAQMKKLGKQKKGAVEKIPYQLEEKPLTVRQFLTSLVALEVRAYQERKEEGQLVGYLTKEEIEDKSQAGKIAFGTQYGNDADENQAADNAIQCFEDGIYRVFAGEEEITRLDDPFIWPEGTTFTFIRLAMLAGLRWGY